MGRESAGQHPKRVASFEVVRQLGEGGMGVVYLARQPTLERTVVLKRMQRELLTDSGLVARFEREARAAATIHHQNVVAVYDCFTVRGDHYIAQEYVDGPDLREVLSRIETLKPRVAALIALEIARGVEEIHARGIIHRDLKPSNIIIGRSGEAKIADFGIALENRGNGLTRPGTMLGSVPYMSPEQMLGERVDYRSDLFSFGILLYEMITGVPPFQESGEDATDTLVERMQSGRYVSPRKLARRVPWYLIWLIHRCLRGKTTRRPGSATHLRRFLERWLGNVSPADCRRQIVEELATRGVLPVDEDKTEPAPARSIRTIRSRLPLRWVIPAAAALMVVTVAMWRWGLGTDERRPPTERAMPAQAGIGLPTNAGHSDTIGLEAATLDREPVGGSDAIDHPLPVDEEPMTAPVDVRPARIYFAAYPWAEIRVPGLDPILTPRAAPVELAPGPYEVRFEHPTYGVASYTLNLAADEERLLRHVFEGAPSP